MLQRFARPLLLALPLLAPIAGCGDASSGDPEPPRPSVTSPLGPETLRRVESVLAEIEADPGNVASRMTLGAVYRANGAPLLARDTYEQVVEMDPENARAWYFLALVRAASKDVEGGLLAFAEAERLDPTYAPILLRRGLMLMENGRLEEAEKDFTAAMQVSPTDPSGAVGLAQAAMARQDWDKAILYLEEINGQVRDRLVMNLLRSAYSESGQTEKAEALVIEDGVTTHIYRMDPWLAEVSTAKVMELADVIREVDSLQQRQEHLEALKVLDRALIDHPRDVELLSRATQSLVELKQFDDAIILLNDAAADLPDNYRIEYLRGSVLLHEGSMPEAASLLTRALELSPSAGDGHFALARAKASMGQPEEALALVEKAHELGFRHVRTEMLQGRLQLDLGRFDEALATFRKVAEAYPDEVAPLAYIAAAHVERQDFDQAEKAIAELTQRRADHPMIPQLSARLEELRGAGEDGAPAPDPNDADR